MRTYIIRRLLLFLPTILGVSLVVFIILRIVPGDPAFVMLAGYEGEGTFTEADLERVRKNLGLDDPIYLQYIKWIWGAVRLDFGRFFLHQYSHMGRSGSKVALDASVCVHGYIFRVHICFAYGCHISCTPRHLGGLRAKSIFYYRSCHANLLGRGLSDFSAHDMV